MFPLKQSNFRSKLLQDPNLKTDVYVWGNGHAKDGVMDYSNYMPKKIKNFASESDPSIISVRFGHYHEAYLDYDGKVHVCEKYRLPQTKIAGRDDCLRQDMQVLEVPGHRITQTEFTKNRLFVLTESGSVYVFILDVVKDEAVISRYFSG